MQSKGTGPFSFYADLPKVYSPPSLYPYNLTKPDGICSGTDSLAFYQLDYKLYIDTKKSIIKKHLENLGFRIGIMNQTDEDFFGVLNFLQSRYSDKQALEICHFDLHRFVEYGHGLLLKDIHNKVVGTVFEVAYDTVEKTSYTIRLAISEECKGKQLGFHLMQYSCLIAMERGARVKRGIIEYNNERSLYINLNKIGWMCDKIYEYIPGLGTFFGIVLPLDPYGLSSNIIELPKLTSFIREKHEGQDYLLIKHQDSEAISDMYHHTEFKVVAFIPRDYIDHNAYFFAVPMLSPE